MSLCMLEEFFLINALFWRNSLSPNSSLLFTFHKVYFRIGYGYEKLKLIYLLKIETLLTHFSTLENKKWMRLGDIINLGSL